jgi:adenylyl-sulfate kinase
VLEPSVELLAEPREVFVAWFTGLPSAGKSTLAALVGRELSRRGVSIEILDGDSFRSERAPALGFSRAERDSNVERMARAASAVAQSGASVLVAAIAPYEQARRRARDIVQAHARFVEVYVVASIDVCIHRDPKGHYEAALKGELRHFTGISDPYEPPTNPDVVIDTDALDPDESALDVLARLEALGLAPAAHAR